MSPLQIMIALHYHAMANDFRDGDFNAPAVSDTIQMFANQKMLEVSETGERKYDPTDRLHAYVRHLCSIPLPVVRWTFEDSQ